MSVNALVPDYELQESLVVTAPAQLRALADPLRSTLLDLLRERAASVTELAQAVSRPKGSVGYHVKTLLEAGLIRVVRTRQVRAVQERFYGRVARTIRIGALERPADREIALAVNGLAEAAREAEPAHAADDLRCSLSHARVSADQVREFWTEVLDLARRFDRMPRTGDQVYGFAIGLYPVDAPVLPRSDGAGE